MLVLFVKGSSAWLLRPITLIAIARRCLNDRQLECVHRRASMAWGNVTAYGSWNLETKSYEGDGKKGPQGMHFDLEMAVWRDPLTPPHTKGPECTKVCDGWFGSKY